jgi:hypothetical protein
MNGEFEAAGYVTLGGRRHVVINRLVEGQKVTFVLLDPDDPLVACYPALQRIARGRIEAHITGRCPECNASRPPLSKGQIAWAHTSACGMTDEAAARIAKAVQN